MAQRKDGRVASVLAAPGNYHSGWHLFIPPSIPLPADKWSTALFDSLETILAPGPDFVVLGREPESGGHTQTNTQIQSGKDTHCHLLKLDGSLIKPVGQSGL